jgi:hypothetical protein
MSGRRPRRASSSQGARHRRRHRRMGSQPLAAPAYRTFVRVVPDCVAPRLPAAGCLKHAPDGRQKGKERGRIPPTRHELQDHNLPDEMALMLNTAVRDLRTASIQDVELVCRARGSSPLVVVRSAELVLQRCQQDRDRHIQSLGDHTEVLDGPPGPAS